MDQTNTTLWAASEYVIAFLKNRLSPSLTFHNVHHTLNVLSAVNVIGKNSQLSAEDMEIAQIAALFHDTGYLYTYRNHEDESIRLAKNFLKQQYYPERKLMRVAGCIGATKIPQHPLNLTEQVLCDADLFHFSQPGYHQLALELRKEWEYYLERKYTDLEWNRLNCAVIRMHCYFTEYGKTILQKGKEPNIRQMESDCD